MSSKGCSGGCIYRREIKLQQMKDTYVCRCAIRKKYLAKADIKSRCNLFKGEVSIKEHTLDEFLET